MNTYAIFGNPISHSQSPYVHTFFAIESGLSHSYKCILAPIDDFEQIFLQFFESGGLGANITLPFKERVFLLCDQVTQRASLSKSVNTVKKLANGKLLGDNTDGIGLVNDLQRLALLQKKSRILLVGAGGAARGVIFPLLTCNCKLVITNRTFSKAQELVRFYYRFGDISSMPLEQLNMPDYDLIINATSAGIQGVVPLLPSSIITPAVFCYDMFYQKGETPFISWCRQHGVLYCADGIGMLVSQAALTFFLWHGIMPSVLPVIKALRAKLAA